MRRGKCKGCQQFTWVNWYIPQIGADMPPDLRKFCVEEAGEYCSECFDRLQLEKRRYPTQGKAATKEDIGPWQENAIREYENRFDE